MPLCPNTFFYSDKNGRSRESPCGKCWFCLQNKRNEWNFRAQVESKSAYTQAFITLSYDPEHVPTTGQFKNDQELFTLSKADIKPFLARLRRENNSMNRIAPPILKYGHKSKKMTYFLIGEYGDNFDRPHYHLLLFNFHPDLRPVLEKIWSKGFIQFAPMTRARIKYVTSYVITNKYNQDEKEKSFAFISNGFGADFVSTALKTLETTKDLYVVDLDRKRLKMPKYYRDKILTTPELKSEFNFQADFENSLRLKRYDLIDQCEKQSMNPFDYEIQVKNQAIDKYNNYNKKRKK